MEPFNALKARNKGVRIGQQVKTALLLKGVSISVVRFYFNWTIAAP